MTQSNPTTRTYRSGTNSHKSAKTFPTKQYHNNSYVTNEDFLKRLREYKSFMKGYVKTNGEAMPRAFKDSIPLDRGRPLYVYMALLNQQEIVVHKGSGKVRQVKRKLDWADRFIIQHYLALGFDPESTNMKIMIRFNNPDYPLMPLNEYIHYLQNGMDIGKIDPKGQIKLEFPETPVENAIMVYKINLKTMEVDGLLASSEVEHATWSAHFKVTNAVFRKVCEARDAILSRVPRFSARNLFDRRRPNTNERR